MLSNRHTGICTYQLKIHVLWRICTSSYKFAYMYVAYADEYLRLEKITPFWFLKLVVIMPSSHSACHESVEPVDCP